VAGYPATGTDDVLQEGVNCDIDEDLSIAVGSALQVSRDNCRRYALTKGWDAVGELFAQELVVITQLKQPSAAG
jgi:hypothetical protein